MAYIATKATYIGEEEVKDENGNPIVDDNENPIKRIKTDVDDVIFSTGEVVVLIEKIDEDKHFDLSIEDKGSEYFAPTQIKIGDGFHSFRELKWLQTLDYNRVHSAIDKSVAEHTANLSKDYAQLKQIVDVRIGLQNQEIRTFTDVTSKEILKKIVNNDYFRITDWGGLVGFTTDPKEYAGKYCISIGNNINVERKAEGYTIGIGKNNTAVGDYSLVIGADNTTKSDYSYVFGKENISLGNYSFVSGIKSRAGESSVACGYWCNYSLVNSSNKLLPYTACFGFNCNTAGMSSFSCNSGNISNGQASFSCGMNNCSEGTSSFTCGQNNNTDKNVEGAFACGNYNNGINKLFSIGNGKIDNEGAEIRTNAFDIDTNGKATFYGDLEVKGKVSYKDITILPTNNNITTIDIIANTSKNIFLNGQQQNYKLSFKFDTNKLYLLGIFYDDNNLVVSDSLNLVSNKEEKPLNRYTICSLGEWESTFIQVSFTQKEIKLDKIRVEFYEI